MASALNAVSYTIVYDYALRGLIDRTHSVHVAPGEDHQPTSLLFDRHAEEFPQIFLGMPRKTKTRPKYHDSVPSGGEADVVCARMCRAVSTRKTTAARKAPPRGRVARSFGSARAEWTAEPPLDDQSRRAGAGFLNVPLPRCSRRAEVGLPRRTAGAQGHNSLPPEHVCRRLQFVDGGAEPPEFDVATLRLLTSSLQQRRLRH
ncbi:hypothetical protein HPB52_021310 [Rhipicephalus sanguineus]|uniref:Uncharacterized protein n=1 Tax=Rhipicephalus sanguineus TaxID=34632 RepID=A0A9D4PFB6_RHISA|nr:hypothetical protein HPB52_021310 [Rhipicephalus sanguineus]